MLQSEAVVVVVSFVFGLHVAASIAEIDGGTGQIVAESHGGEGAEAYAALVDVVVGTRTGIGALAAPDIKDAVGAAGDDHAVFGDFGIVDIDSEGEFEVEEFGERHAFEDGEVDKDAFFEAEDVARHILTAARDADTVVAGEKKLAGSGELAEIEVEHPTPSAVVVVAQTCADLVGELIVHAGVFDNGEGAIGWDGTGRDEALVDEAGPYLCAVLLGTEHAVNGVVVAGASAIEVGLFGVGDEKACIDDEGEASDAGLGR